VNLHRVLQQLAVLHSHCESSTAPATCVTKGDLGVCSELLYILDATIFVASRSDGVKLTDLLIDGCLEIFFVENLGRTSEVNDITYI